VAEELADANVAHGSNSTLWRGGTAPMNRSVDTVMDAPNRRTSLIAALCIGVASAIALAVHRTGDIGVHRPDFDHLYAAARFVLAGRDPYQLIGEGREFYNSWPLYYPLPGILPLALLSPLPVDIARLVFVFAVTTCFGYALARQGGTRFRFAAVASMPYVQSVWIAQWSPLLFAMWSLPAVAAFAVVKPNYSLALLGARGRARSLVIATVAGLGLIAVSFALQPHWLSEWIALVRAAHHFTIPLLRPGGFLLILAALKWRRPEARLLLLLSLMPATSGYYDLLLLFLVARSAPEIVALVLAGLIQEQVMNAGTYANWDALFASHGRLAIWFFFLPALAMVMRRPNEGSLPGWLDRRTHAWPSWLRGTSPATVT
jgi:hypothetical protein